MSFLAVVVALGWSPDQPKTWDGFTPKLEEYEAQYLKKSQMTQEPTQDVNSKQIRAGCISLLSMNRSSLFSLAAIQRCVSMLTTAALVLVATTSTLHAQGPGGATEVSEAVAGPAPEGFLDIVMSGGWVGMSIVFLLLALSITAAYLVIDHLMTIRRSEIMPAGLGDEVRRLLTAGRVSEASDACRKRPSFLSFVLLNGIGEIEGGWTAVEKAIEDAIAEQSARLFRKIEYLSVIGNIAPMVGLLGTVTGMIIAFQRVAITQGSAGAGDLAEGIYQALVTTVGGLIVAIPSLGAFAVFRNRIDQFVAEAAYMAQHAFMPLKRMRVSGRTQSAPTPPPAQENG